MQVMWVQSLGQEDPLEEEIVTHFRILAYKSHGQRSLGGCSPWGCKELGTTNHQHASIFWLYCLLFLHLSVDGHLSFLLFYHCNPHPVNSIPLKPFF